MTVLQHVDAGAARLVSAGLDPRHAAVDAEVLARHALGWTRARYLTDRRDPPPPRFAHEYAELLARRTTREPVSLITGVREFWGLAFEVTDAVLTPRPETELLVERTLAEADARMGAPLRIVDVGTGSGCVAITLAHRLRSARLTATDLSARALAVARRNARRHAVADRIAWVRTSVLDGLAVQADVIVSNPPYVPIGAIVGLPPEVREFEPHEALAGGNDGLAVIRQLLRQSADRLTPGGALLIELGAGQSSAVERLVAGDDRLALQDIAPDLQGIPRVALVRRAGGAR